MERAVTSLAADGKKSKRLFFWARVSIIMALYAILLRSIDLQKLQQVVSPSIIPAILMAVLLITLQALFCTYRWRFLAQMRTSDTPGFWYSFWVYEENIFANQFLPSTVGGDLLRVIRWQQAGMRGLPAAASVFLDRLSGINGAAVIALIAVVVLSPFWDKGITLIALLLAAIVLVGTAGGFFLMRWPRLFDPLRRFQRLWDVVETLRRNLSYDIAFTKAIVMSIFGHLIGGLATYVLGLGLSIDVGLFSIVAVSCLTAIAAMVPISLAGWGIREASFIAFLTPLGVDSYQAFALGLLLGLVTFLAALPGGLVALLGLTGDKSISEIRKTAGN